MANEFIIRKGYKSLSDSQITGSLSVSNAVTASFFTGSFRGDGSELTGIDGFPFTGSASISGSLTIVGPVTATEFIGNGSQLTGIEGFPYTGSAIISGSLQVTGSISTDTDATINSLTVGKGGGNQENNTVLGYEALISNVEGEGNVAVGYKALSSSLAGMGPNTALGSQALRDNVYGFRNTAIGNATLLNNSNGIFNTAVGHIALVNNIDGSYNNALGDGALSENTSGENNIAIGHDALHDNTEGDNNVSIGNSSLYNNITGSNNTAIGTDAGQYAGASVTSLTSVDNSIFIGYQSRALNAVGDTNEIVIGHNIVGLGSNTTVIGNNNTVSTTLKGAVSASLFSGSFAGDGSQLTGIDGFPFTGSAAVSGSLTVVGPVNATSFTGSIRGTATTASYVNIANVDGFTAYSSSVNTAIGSVLDATTPITATINNTNSPFTITNQTIVIVDSTNGNVTVNLPNLNTIVGTPNQKPIVVYKNDYSQNVIYVSPSGSQLINGASQDIIVSIQLAVIYNPTSAGWVTEGTSAQSLAELELFFVPKTETGSLSVATASYVEYTDVVNKPTLVSGSSQISFSGITNKPTLVSGSSQVTYSGLTGIPSGIVSSSVQVKEYNVFATTGSNQFNGNQSITGSLTVSGQVVAQTLNVQQVTSSIVYSSGSNIFGNSVSNVQQFTGSLQVSGSSHYVLGNVGINTSSPSTALTVIGNVKAGYDPGVGLTIGLSPVGIPNNDLNAYILWGDYASFGGNNGDLIYIPRTSTSADHRFYTGNVGLATEKMRISYTGNVGIGSTSPSATLDIGSSKNLSGTDPISVYTDVRVASAVTGGLIGYNVRMVALAGSYTVANMYGIKTNTAVVQSGVTVTNSYGIYIGRTDDPSSGGVVTNKYALVTEALAGNVGIGTLIPYSNLEINKTLGASFGVNHAADAATYPKASGIGLGAPSTSYTVASGGGTISFVGGAGMYAENTALSGNPTNLVFWTNLAGTPAERMRITSGGKVQIGTGTPDGTLTINSTTTSLSVITNADSSVKAGYFWHQATSGDNQLIQFFTEAGASQRGAIDYNRGAGLLRFVTTSDKNLKNIIGDSDKQKSVNLLNSTRIREYSWKDDESNKPQIGVIAQELHETYKGAVSIGSDEELLGTKDYKPWAVDKTAFTFHLIAGFQEHERIIQEQQSQIEILKAEIQTLKQ